MKINDKLRELRTVLGLSRKKFAAACGLSLTAISYFENGERIPSEESLRKIIDAFHINGERFFRDLDLDTERHLRKISIDERWLRRQYVEKELPAAQIAGQYGYSKSTVLSRLREYQIPRRPKFGHAGPQPPSQYPEVVSYLCEGRGDPLKVLDGLSSREALILGKRLGLGKTPVQTLESIGAELNLTRERVRQIQNLALRKLSSLPGLRNRHAAS